MNNASHLAFKEIWRNKGRFLLFSLVIALITVLILFVAALGEGLGAGNREYLEKLDGELIVFQATARLSIPSSRLERDRLPQLRNIEGVQDVGPVGFSAAAIPLGGRSDLFDVSLIGVEPGLPGMPPVVDGQPLIRRTTDEVLIDSTVALVTDAKVGDWLLFRSIQGSDEEFYRLRVVGITDSQKYSIRPSVFVPYVTWARIRPQALVGSGLNDLSSHIMVVKLVDPAEIDVVRQRIEARVSNVQAVDRRTAYENTPGYREQQSTLQTQNGFALLIGLLVIGGFFQIQTLQKVGQIGMLKAIGTPEVLIASALLIQIAIINAVGVGLGGLASLGLSFVFPANVPIIFEPRSAAMAVGSILVMGPLGGLVSIRYSLGIEPLTALGLSS